MTVHVFDFFSGCGGTSAGFRAAGMRIELGLDLDADAETTFRLNFPTADFIQEDITTIETDRLKPAIERCRDEPILFCGCAPCQPFSRQRSTKKDPSRGKDLLDEFGRFVNAYRPDLIFCENVPGIQSVSTTDGPFARFLRTLRRLKYQFTHEIIACQDFGVPQMRRRLILIANLHGPISLPKATHGPSTKRKHTTVWDTIGSLPPIQAGQTHCDDGMHRAAALSPLNLRRIRATPIGGGRRDWPRDLLLACHKKKCGANPYRGHTDVYGRLRKDAPASALTTRCISLSNGRFGHPEQDRAMSIREAALLQTFPRTFVFAGSLGSMSRQIGNAVPALLAKRFGRHLIKLQARSRSTDAHL